MHPNVTPKRGPDDPLLDLTLRPKQWHEYIGQERLKKNLKILIDAAQTRREALEHVLLSGPAGLGKTSMAYLIAREMNTNLRVTSGPAIEKVGDLASILTNLLPNDILFIDEAHRLNKLIEEVLYPAMESRTLDIVIGKGPSARILQIELPPFTLIAATTRIGLLSSPLRSRFGGTFRLDFYSTEEISKIIARSARLLRIEIEEKAITRLASSSRFTPRVANRLLKRARDLTQVERKNLITDEMAKQALDLLEIDGSGLEPMDRRILEVIIKKFGGGPGGLSSPAAASAPKKNTI